MKHDDRLYWITPTDIEVPSDEPFRFDQLDRKAAVETLAEIVNSAVSPCVIAIDGEWGSGKTTFLKMSCAYLRAGGSHVVEFNAWETDFASNAFQALSAELTQSLEPADPNLAGMLRLAAIPVLKGLTKFGVGILVPSAVEAVDAVIQTVSAASEGDPISEYRSLKESIERFRKALKEAAAGFAGQTGGKPLVIAIDELDRCRPSYAIELLEIAKHIFEIDNVVFILAVNSSELAHSVKSLYGSEFDAEGYLRRFFHLPIKLTNPYNDKFAEFLLGRIEWQMSDRYGRASYGMNRLIATRLLTKLAERSLRDADQAAARIDLVSRLSGAMGSDLGTVAIIGLILKTTNSQLYRDVSKGIISDDEIVNSILGTLFADVRDFVELDRLSALKVFVEATIIAVSAPPVRAIIDQQPRANLEEVFRSRSERLSGYVRKLAEHDTGSNFLPAGDHRNLETVLRISYETWNTLSTEDERPALVRAAAMLELLAG